LVLPFVLFSVVRFFSVVIDFFVSPIQFRSAAMFSLAVRHARQGRLALQRRADAHAYRSKECTLVSDEPRIHEDRLHRSGPNDQQASDGKIEKNRSSPSISTQPTGQRASLEGL